MIGRFFFSEFILLFNAPFQVVWLVKSKKFGFLSSKQKVSFFAKLREF